MSHRNENQNQNQVLIESPFEERQSTLTTCQLCITTVSVTCRAVINDQLLWITFSIRLNHKIVCLLWRRCSVRTVWLKQGLRLVRTCSTLFVRGNLHKRFDWENWTQKELQKCAIALTQRAFVASPFPLIPFRMQLGKIEIAIYFTSPPILTLHPYIVTIFPFCSSPVTATLIVPWIPFSIVRSAIFFQIFFFFCLVFLFVTVAFVTLESRIHPLDEVPD